MIKNIKPKNLAIAVLVGLLGYAMLTAMLFLFQRNLIYRPTPVVPEKPAWMESVDLKTEDGLTLKGWWRAPEKNRPTLLYFQGNAGHMKQRLFKVAPYVNKGFGVLMFSWRGFAGNPGSPTEEGLYQDGHAALNFLKAQKIPHHNIFLYGESLGAAVAIKMDTEQKKNFLSVILESPFTSIPEVGKGIYPLMPVETLALDPFMNIDIIQEMTSPLLLVAGMQSPLVSFSQSDRLLKKAGSKIKKGLLYPHLSDFELHDRSVFEDIILFLNKAIKA